jgi:hypothetical protein
MADRSAGRLRKFGPTVLSAIGRQEWLDRPSYRLEHLLSFVFNGFGRARNTITNALNGVWLGHPVHPPLASLTSGALGTTNTAAPLCTSFAPRGAPRWYALYSCGSIDE